MLMTVNDSLFIEVKMSRTMFILYSIVYRCFHLPRCVCLIKFMHICIGINVCTIIKNQINLPTSRLVRCNWQTYFFNTTKISLVYKVLKIIWNLPHVICTVSTTSESPFTNVFILLCHNDVVTNVYSIID